MRMKVQCLAGLVAFLSLSAAALAHVGSNVRTPLRNKRLKLPQLLNLPNRRKTPVLLRGPPPRRGLRACSLRKEKFI